MKTKHKIILFSIIILSLIAFLTMCLMPVTVQSDERTANCKQIVHEDALNIYLSKTDFDKSAGSNGETRTATYLSDFLHQNNCDYWNNATSYLQEFTIGFGQVSNNVIGVKKSKNETNNYVLIGAHYDNAFTSKNKTNGAINNATGVVTLMSLIENLSSCELDFNIIYCFFGASNYDLLGSKAFVNSLTREQKQNLLLNINIDSIGCGEHTYYYAGDASNSFVKSFNFNNYSIESMPTYSKTKYFLTKENLAFSHHGLISDNVPFLNAKIKSISFFGGNLTSMNAGFKESDQFKNISGTTLDTSNTLNEYYPDHMNKINQVANVIYDTLNNPNLVESLKDSYDEIDLSFFNNKLIILALGIFGVLLLCGIKTKTANEIIKEENE